jgi:hypothetical protein
MVTDGTYTLAEILILPEETPLAPMKLVSSNV